VASPERSTLLRVVINARYVHTNLIAQDWRALAAFYVNVFGCVPVPPERDYRGADLDALTGLTGAHQRGVHLRLPGQGEAGPTLEVFELTPDATGNRAINAHGFGHIAFEVPDVTTAQRAVLEAGGSAIGEVVTLTRADGWRVTVCYVTDPEGNALELQAWSAPI
jgi:predicted enzyme related to lactoylglutathione lyase